MALATTAPPPALASLNDLFETERQLVGLILARPGAQARIALILTGEDWTERLHRGVFETAGALVEDGQPITLAAILPRVSDVGPDGLPAEAYLKARIAQAPPLVRAEPLARLLAGASALRERPDIYGHDAYAWAFAQAEKLRRGQFSSLDALNLAEEIEDLGSEIYNRLESALRIVLLHLLKWDHQPERRTRSWTLSIRTGRLDVQELLERRPSLKPRLPGAIIHAYRRARLEAAAETGLDDEAFPAACPYSYDAIMTWPIPWPPTHGNT